MRKLITSLCIILAVMLCVTTAFASDINVFLNGNIIDFADQTPVIDNGRTLVPLRSVLEKMGAKVTWDDITKTATVEYEEDKVQITIGENALYKNGEAMAIDVPAQLINSRTMVPLRSISESFGVKVGWDGEARTVIVSSDSLFNESIEKAVESKDFFWRGTGKVELEKDEKDFEMVIARDSENDISILGMVIKGAKEENSVYMIYKNGKVITLKDGVITQENSGTDFFGGESMVDFNSPFKKVDDAKNYAIYEDIFSDAGRIKIYKDGKTPMELTTVAEKISVMEGVKFSGDISGQIVINGEKTQSLYKELVK